MNHAQSAETLGDLQGILNHQAINCIYTYFLGSFFKSATIRLFTTVMKLEEYS